MRSTCVDTLRLWRKLVLVSKTGRMKKKIGNEHRTSVTAEGQAEIQVN